MKEYFLPELSADVLWRVYKSDEEWTKLQYNIAILMEFFNEIKRNQSEKLTESIPENVRVLKDEDFIRLRMVKSSVELSAVLQHFILYYGNDVPAMLEKYLRMESEEAKEDGEPMDANELKNFLLDPDHVNLHAYYLCARAGLYGLLKKYALSPEQLAENMRDNCQQHKVSHTTTEPLFAAVEYVSLEFPNPSEVLKMANYMLAVQIAKEPLILQCVRESFFERARIDVIPTEKGLMEIDENHNLYPLKSLKDKPVRDLVDDQFLRLMVAEQDGLLTVVFQTKIEGATTASYVDEIKALFTQGGVQKYVEEWNVLHNEIIDLAISKFVFPALVKELKAKLLYEAGEFVKRACCQQLYNWLNVSFIVTQILFPFQ
jgi:transcription elongation factor SPT6